MSLSTSYNNNCNEKFRFSCIKIKLSDTHCRAALHALFAANLPVMISLNASRKSNLILTPMIRGQCCGMVMAIADEGRRRTLAAIEHATSAHSTTPAAADHACSGSRLNFRRDIQESATVKSRKSGLSRAQDVQHMNMQERLPFKKLKCTSSAVCCHKILAR